MLKRAAKSTPCNSGIFQLFKLLSFLVSSLFFALLCNLLHPDSKIKEKHTSSPWFRSDSLTTVWRFNLKLILRSILYCYFVWGCMDGWILIWFWMSISNLLNKLIKFNLILFLHIVFICLQILGSPEAEDLGHKNADIHCWILVIYQISTLPFSPTWLSGLQIKRILQIADIYAGRSSHFSKTGPSQLALTLKYLSLVGV